MEKVHKTLGILNAWKKFMKSVIRRVVSTRVKNRSAKRTRGYCMPLVASRTRARVPFGTSFASHVHVHAYEVEKIRFF